MLLAVRLRGVGSSAGAGERGTPGKGTGAAPGKKAGAAGGEVGQAGGGRTTAEPSMEAGAAWGATGEESPAGQPRAPAFLAVPSPRPPLVSGFSAGLALRRCR